MRASIFRPMFDRLDTRIVLDDSVVGSLVPVVGTVLTATPVDPSSGTSCVVPDTGWYQGGTNPSTSDSSIITTIPIAYQTAVSLIAD